MGKKNLPQALRLSLLQLTHPDPSLIHSRAIDLVPLPISHGQDYRTGSNGNLWVSGEKVYKP